ncbi:hypothetical protein [Pontiella desulfatans]|uniref:hypothetical protein n=1 Tax=Pontiella desulfatans TaxID=2750659 RepID=UPI00109CD771|nr:hypothetical protein [Pontiella desulfatans]
MMMKKIAVVLFIAFGGLISVHAKPITITDRLENFVVEKGVDAAPDEKGFVVSREVELPTFEQGAYYRPYVDDRKSQGNKVEAVAFDSIRSLQSYQPSLTRKDHDFIQQGQFILLKIKDSKYIALLPMASRDVYCQFFVEQGKILLKAGSFGTQRIKGDLPLLIWSYGSSPYAATKSVWKRAIESGHVAVDWRSRSLPLKTIETISAAWRSISEKRRTPCSRCPLGNGSSESRRANATIPT